MEINLWDLIKSNFRFRMKIFFWNTGPKLTVRKLVFLTDAISMDDYDFIGIGEGGKQEDLKYIKDLLISKGYTTYFYSFALLDLP